METLKCDHQSDFTFRNQIKKRLRQSYLIPKKKGCHRRIKCLYHRRIKMSYALGKQHTVLDGYSRSVEIVESKYRNKIFYVTLKFNDQK